MSENPFVKIYEQIEDAKDNIEVAIALVREERMKALEREDMNMVNVFKKLNIILKNVLED